MLRELSNTEIISLMGQRLKQYRLNLAITQREMSMMCKICQIIFYSANLFVFFLVKQFGTYDTP